MVRVSVSIIRVRNMVRVRVSSDGKQVGLGCHLQILASPFYVAYFLQ